MNLATLALIATLTLPIFAQTTTTPATTPTLDSTITTSTSARPHRPRRQICLDLSAQK